MKNDVNIHDIRKPKKAEELRFWNGDIKKLKSQKWLYLEQTVQREKEQCVNSWFRL